ncbi:MAG: RHS repeat-associated core domain-containing protein [Candidatus Sulfotelmatobacter sp.]
MDWLGSNYDTVSTFRGFSTVIPTIQTTNPCSVGSGASCPTTYGPTASGSVSSTGVLTSILTQSGSNAVAKTTYNEGDVTAILGPAPSGENTKGIENEYNGAGWLTSSCAISSVVTGEGACGQRTGSNSGILTTVDYSASTGSEKVQSCRGSTQCPATITDGLGRVTTKFTPEGGTWTYTYDTACSSSYTNTAGRLAKTVDPNGNTLCYSYDALGRILLVNATNGTTSSCRGYWYDSATEFPTGVTVANGAGRMIEAYTWGCGETSAITDEWFSYDKDGRVTTEWQLTPNSTQYYESTTTYTGPAITSVDLASPSIFTATYGLDGEGRWNALSVGSATDIPASGVVYNSAGQPVEISIGTGTDFDTYTYDFNTLQMTSWEYQVGSEDEYSAIYWNPNNTLEKLSVTDGFNTNGTIICSYNSGLVSGTGYDDLGRLIGHSCGGAGGTWSQAFSYDQFNNIKTTGTGLPNWNPGYSPTTNHYTCTGCTYDSNGDVTNDGTNAYTWNAFSKMASLNMSGTGCATNGDCIVYDAFGRDVEIDNGSTTTEIWYTPIGKQYMNGATSVYGYEAAPGGGTIVGTLYMHKDWMGNARIVSSIPSATITTDRAYTPYGYPFNIFGGTGQNMTMFVGLTQDIFSGMYDTPNREMTSVQSRFMSPDPAGSGWNQYAYPTNPNSASDPSGLTPGGPTGPTCNIARGGGLYHANYSCSSVPTDEGGDDGEDPGDDSGFLGSDGFGDPFAGAGGPSISPLDPDLYAENVAAVYEAMGPGLNLFGSVGADSSGFTPQFSTRDTDDSLGLAPTLLYPGESAEISDPSTYDDFSGDIGDVSLMLADFNLGAINDPDQTAISGSGARRVRTATCSLIGQAWRVCGYSCNEPATGAVAVSWFTLGEIQKTPVCSAYTSCPKYVFVEIIGHAAFITGCSQSN